MSELTVATACVHKIGVVDGPVARIDFTTEQCHDCFTQFRTIRDASEHWAKNAKVEEFRVPQGFRAPPGMDAKASGQWIESLMGIINHYQPERVVLGDMSRWDFCWTADSEETRKMCRTVARRAVESVLCTTLDYEFEGAAVHDLSDHDILWKRYWDKKSGIAFRPESKRTGRPSH